MPHRPRRPLILLAAAIALATTVPAGAARSSRDQWQQPDRVVADLGLTDGSVVADVGCGRGYFVFRLAKAVGKTGTVYAEDISEKALKGLKSQADRDGAANVQVVLGEPTDTHLPDAALDAALIVNVYHHVPEKDRPGLTADIVRALKPGGYLFIIDWQLDAKIPYDKGRRIPKDQLIRYGTDAGLVLDAEFLYLEHQVFLRLRKPAK